MLKLPKGAQKPIRLRHAGTATWHRMHRRDHRWLQGGHIRALMVAGGLVMQHAPGGDWKRVDWDALAAWLDRHGYKVADCKTETLPTADAASGNARVKTHRR